VIVPLLKLIAAVIAPLCIAVVSWFYHASRLCITLRTVADDLLLATAAGGSIFSVVSGLGNSRRDSCAAGVALDIHRWWWHPIWQWSATDTADANRDGRITSGEVVQAHIDLMRGTNTPINAVVVDPGAQAIEAARKQGAPLGKLHGEPVSVKINIDVEGQANSNGVVGFRNNIAPGDSPVTANLKKAGVIIIGMTNTLEFSMRGFTSNPLLGLTENPWNHAINLWRLIRRGGRIDCCGRRRHRARQRYRRLAEMASLLQMVLPPSSRRRGASPRSIRVRR
jgi:hypothetical protein